MAVGEVRHFSRALESDVESQGPGWIEWGREEIPSLPLSRGHEPIVLLVREGELPLPDEKVATSQEGSNSEPAKHPRGMKLDEGKDRWGLLLVMLGQQVRDVLHGLMYGAKKYKEDPADPNYRKVEDAERRFSEAAMRHLFDRMNGIRIDADSGQKNLALAAINIFFWMWHDDNKKQES